jgi:drug/metabolite transporter (DMT)-like permease
MSDRATGVVSTSRTADRTWLVALAAALWGTDALFRLPLVTELSAATIVLAEHVILVLVTLPWLPRAIRAATRVCRPVDWWALIFIGAGASAAATVLFTMAFRFGGPITPVALQKMQPLLAAAAACLFLGERLRPRYGLFLIVAIASAWLLSFPNPLDVTVAGLSAALLALGAAALWAGGTVAGRQVSLRLDFTSITVLRFAIGLPAALVVAIATGAPLFPSASDVLGLVGLALVPGLVALLLYYRGLQSTPAARATIAELAFPITAAIVGVTVLERPLTWSQWTGFVLLLITVVAFARHEQRAEHTAVIPPTKQIASVG